MPEEDRLHYAVMLFDPPAAEWIFNYRRNNRYVEWGDFLEDVRHRFDRRGYPTFDHWPRRVETCRDPHHHREGVRAPRDQSACHQPYRNADQPLGSSTCWDPSGLRTQQRYPADDISFERFGSDDLCWERRSSLSHNRYIESSMPSPTMEKQSTPSLRSLGSRCKPDYQVDVGMREREADETSVSSSLAEQNAYSCVEARILDCVDDRGTGEEELGDFEDSVVVTATKKTRDRDADSSDTGSVSNVAIRLPSENHGSRERRDTGPDDQQVICYGDTTCSPDVSKEKEEDDLFDDEVEDDYADEVKKVVDSSSVVRVPSKNDVGNCWGRKGGGAYTALHEIVRVYVDGSVGNITSMNHRSMSLTTDKRLIPPRINTPCLSILGGRDKLFVLAGNFAYHIGYSLVIFDGGYEGRLSALRLAFDPGGEASQKSLLSILVVASNEGAMLRKLSKDSLLVDERKSTFDSVFDDKSGDLLDPTQWEFEIKVEVRNGCAFARLQRPCTFTFDPGGNTLSKLILSTLRCFMVSTLRTSWFLRRGELLGTHRPAVSSPSRRRGAWLN